ncbi:MAG: LysR substrate-binding domain-containing protein, partial [Pseudomonadota bacterium]
TIRPLFTEPFLLAQQTSAPGTGEAVSAEAVGDMRLLLLEEGHCLRDQALSFCAVGATQDRLDASSLTTLVQMAAAGMGATVIPAIAASVECSGAGVSLSPFAPPAPTRTVVLVWRESSPMAVHFEGVAALLRPVTSRLIPAVPGA